MSRVATGRLPRGDLTVSSLAAPESDLPLLRIAAVCAASTTIRRLLCSAPYGARQHCLLEQGCTPNSYSEHHIVQRIERTTEDLQSEILRCLCGSSHAEHQERPYPLSMKMAQALYTKKQEHREREQYVNQVPIHKYLERTRVSGTSYEMEATDCQTDANYNMFVSAAISAVCRYHWSTCNTQ